MKDLSSIMFCVPVIDKHSPFTYSFVNDVHWFDKDVKHSGIETTWRQVLKTARTSSKDVALSRSSESFVKDADI